ncbi:5-carboxymethyl-2-hydroxymuconate isomerase [Bradyrhizobium japonicum]|nr:5-carboxymethyl-2-hydroxymuconate Delta-isomerase [Bradyrhizobium japonicum]AJA66497.1 5-carboxymethyl-2-hydroxymuconate isomerase [Bradyrhizobium japonicum]KMJ99792.1 5-carboxymethyl-2-hydroxymuconate isomerase [Bradyrhizobium japonicum]MYV87647.1 5-carboxymethyl-2-hydroxymuconate isomerase [Bradyrhizobium japonicum]
MPHLVVDYSDGSFDPERISELLLELADAAWRTGVMKAEDVKIRAQPYEHYLVAGKQDSFVHVTVYLLEGRNSAQKVELSVRLREVLTSRCAAVTSLSVDIRDMDSLAYKKRLR